MLLMVLAVSLPAIAIELLLLEHVGDAWQLTPFVVIALSGIALAWHALRPGGASLLYLRATMALSILSGALGVYLHFRGNVAFELEMTPGAAGLPLFRDAMMGATPALAPGTMALVGALGLLYSMLAEPGGKPPR